MNEHAFPNDRLFDQLQKVNVQAAVTQFPQLALSMALNEQVQNSDDAICLLHQFLKARHFHAFAGFLALGLPLRELVWWAYLACLSAEVSTASTDVLEALTYLRDWVYTQDHEHGLALQQRLATLPRFALTRWAALAVWWSGDNIASPEAPPVKPSPLMAKIAAWNAIRLGGERLKPSAEKFPQLLLQGVHIANHGNGHLNADLLQRLERFLAEGTSQWT